jgi:hypothetical protein
MCQPPSRKASRQHSCPEGGGSSRQTEQPPPWAGQNSQLNTVMEVLYLPEFLLCHTTACRPDGVNLVAPESTTRPAATNSTRRGRCVLGFISNASWHSESVQPASPQERMNRSTRRLSSGISGLISSAAATDVGECRWAGGSRWSKRVAIGYLPLVLVLPATSAFLARYSANASSPCSP